MLLMVSKNATVNNLVLVISIISNRNQVSISSFTSSCKYAFSPDGTLKLIRFAI